MSPEQSLRTSFIEPELPLKLLKEKQVVPIEESSLQSKKQNNLIKRLRIDLGQALQSISQSNLREVDQIRKPQKYMYFCVHLFKVLYDLIIKMNDLIK